MQTLERDLAIGAIIGGLALMLAMVWGAPFALTSPPPDPDWQQLSLSQQSRPQAKQPFHSAVFTGTVIRDGSQYALRDASGTVYKLDDSERAKPYKGKPVKVKGQFDQQANMIHVESIEAAEG